MKTYEQILDEVLEDDLHNVKPEGIEGVRVRVAKAYAKEWITKVVIEMADVPPNTLIEMYHGQIDNHK